MSSCVCSIPHRKIAYSFHLDEPPSQIVSHVGFSRYVPTGASCLRSVLPLQAHDIQSLELQIDYHCHLVIRIANKLLLQTPETWTFQTQHLQLCQLTLEIWTLQTQHLQL